MGSGINKMVISVAIHETRVEIARTYLFPQCPLTLGSQLCSTGTPKKALAEIILSHQRTPATPIRQTEIRQYR